MERNSNMHSLMLIFLEVIDYMIRVSDLAKEGDENYARDILLASPYLDSLENLQESPHMDVCQKVQNIIELYFEAD